MWKHLEINDFVLTLFKSISDKQLERHRQSAQDSDTTADEEVTDLATDLVT